VGNQNPKKKKEHHNPQPHSPPPPNTPKQKKPCVHASLGVDLSPLYICSAVFIGFSFLCFCGYTPNDERRRLLTSRRSNLFNRLVESLISLFPPRLFFFLALDTFLDQFGYFQLFFRNPASTCFLGILVVSPGRTHTDHRRTSRSLADVHLFRPFPPPPLFTCPIHKSFPPIQNIWIYSPIDLRLFPRILTW